MVAGAAIPMTWLGATNRGYVAVIPSPPIFQEDFTGVPTGNVTLDSSWTAKKYVDITKTAASDIQILTRAGMPANLLADPRFPAGKTRCCLMNMSALEDQSLLNWSGFPNLTTRTTAFSWWEYRDNGNFGGEKDIRVGNYVGGVVLANRGIDAIIGIDATTKALSLFSNSLNMHQFPDQAMGNLGTFPPGLIHCEAVYTLPADTSATGSCQFYINGVLVGTATNLQFYDTSGQAAFGFQLWDIGGWASGSAILPIKRYFCACRVATTRQGQWAMNGV